MIKKRMQRRSRMPLRAEIAALCLGMVTPVVHAQVEWIHYVDTSYYGSGLGAAVEYGDGQILIPYSVFHAPFTYPENRYMILDASGISVADEPDPWGRHYPFLKQADGGFQCLASVLDTANGIIPAFVHVVIDADLNTLRMDTIPMDPQASRYPSGVTLDPMGNLIVAAGVDLISAPGQLNRMRFLRLDPDGEETADRWYEGGYYDPIDLRAENDTYHVLFVGTTLGPWGPSKVLRFDTDFNYTDGFVIPTLTGEPYAPGADSMGYVNEMVLTNDGGAIVSQILYGPGGSSIAESWLVRYTADGTITHTFHSPSQTMNTELVLRSLTRLPDGSILWAYKEYPDQNSSLSRVHVYVLDMDLQVLSHRVLDGVDEGLSFDANFMSETIDGGVLLSGIARNLLSVSAHSVGFVAKLGGFTAVLEAATIGTQVLRTYPNPGTQGFTVQLPKEQRSGMIAVYDGRGALVHTMPIASGPVTVDAATWPAGLYVVRATALDGRPIGSSVWAKE